MIFAEIEHPSHYSRSHAEVAAFVRTHFSQVTSGLQGDSWIWISDGGEKVQIDTFSSMKHQIKSARPGPHVQQVIDALLLKYKVRVYQAPELEGHEDA